MNPVTKDELIERVLTMFRMGALDMEITVSQIKHFAEDNRISWKN